MLILMSWALTRWCRLKKNYIDLKEAFKALCELGITSILFEGGGKILRNAFKLKLINEMWYFMVPVSVGNEGMAGLG